MALTKFRIPSDLEVSGSTYHTGSVYVKGVISGSDAVSASFFTSSNKGGFVGDGSALTNITASYVNDLTQAKLGLVALSASSYISASKFVGSGAELTNLPTPSTISGDYVQTVSSSNSNLTVQGTAAGSAFKGAVTMSFSSTPTFNSISASDSNATSTFEGSVTIKKNLYVLGDTVELQVSTLKVEDAVITIASGSTSRSNLYNYSGAPVGIEWGESQTGVSLKYDFSKDQLSSSLGLNVATGNISASNGYVSASLGFVGDGSRLTNVSSSVEVVGAEARGTWLHNASQTIVSFSTGNYAAGKFSMLFEQKDTGRRQISEFFVGHSGSTAFITQYNDIYMSADQARLVTLDVASAVGASGVINVTASRDPAQLTTFLTGNYVTSRLYMVKPV